MSNVIPRSAVLTSPKTVAPGYLSCLSSHHLDIFLSALDLSYATALKFDCRPGLKFLVQKVANLSQPANLYRQAGVAWTIKVVTLFELCLREVEYTEASLETVKMALTSNPEDRERLKDSNLQRLSKYLRQLRITFEELCESYVEVVLDEDGRHARVDSFCEKKVFLPVAQPDDFPEMTRKKSTSDRPLATPAPVKLPVDTEDSEDQEDQEVQEVQEDQEDQEDPEDQEDIENYNPNLDGESGLDELGPECEDDPRPFRLSDLAVEYSTDSGPQSEPETNDSRPVSRLGSVTEKAVYSDRSGGTTSSEGYIDGKYSSTTPAPLHLINARDNLYYKFSPLRRPEFGNSFGTSVLEIKTMNSGLTYDELSLFHKSKLERRRSDACLLTRKSSLRFVEPVETDDSDKFVRFNANTTRCRSVIELRKTAGSAVSGSSNDLEMSPRVSPKIEGKEDELPKIFDNIDELLRDYEISKRGFRTNPFLRKEEAECNVETEEIPSHESLFQRKSNACKDSEAHRNAWAEMLSTVLDWTLALSVSRKYFAEPFVIPPRILSKPFVIPRILYRMIN